MNKRLMFLLLITICFLSVDAKKANHITRDSLFFLLNQSNEVTQQAHWYNELADELKYSAPDSARLFAQKAYDLAELHNIIEEKDDALMRLGVLAAIDGDYPQSDSLFAEALEIRNKIGIKTDIASTLNNRGLVSSFQGNISEAIAFYKQGLQVLEEEKLSDEEAMLCTNIAESYGLQGKSAEALKFINRGLSIMDDLGDPSGKSNLLLMQGNWYKDVDNYKKAEDSYLASLDLFEKADEQNGVAKCFLNLGSVYFSLRDLDKSLQYYTKATKLKSFLYNVDLALLYQGRGNVYMLKEKISYALENFKNSLALFEELESAPDIAIAHFNLGSLYKSEENYEQALVHFKDSQSILDTIYSEPSLNMKLAEEISVTYAKLNKPLLAFQYSQKHNALQDSLNNNFKMAMNYKSNYEEEQRKYESAQKENEILLKENELQTSENKRKSFRINAMIIGGILWLLLSGATFLAYVNRKKRQQAYLKIDGLIKDRQLEKSYAKLEGQDEERTRIAQDLHDRVGSILSTVMLYFRGVDSKLETLSENQSQMIKANELLHKAVGEVRRISQNIQSATLTKFGLKEELTGFADLLKDSNQIKVKVVTHGLENRLPSAMEIKIYRIIQELISNVLKHAMASEIVVQVNKFKDVINVLVEDNGKGFNVEIANKKNSMGLDNIRSRVYDLHGTIIIDSSEGRGTTVAIDIPLEE